MTYTVIVLLTRHHKLTSEQFRDHYENAYMPLAYSLLCHWWPISFQRQYLARINRKGFGGPANPDWPPLMLRGLVSGDFDYDCISEMTFENEAHFRVFYRNMHAKETAAKLTCEEENFLEEGKMRVMVVGETWSTDQAGITSRDVGQGLMCESSNSSDVNSNLS